MGSRTNRAIDLAIEKKLQKSFVIKSPRNQLSKFSNYCAVKKYDAIKHASDISDITGIESVLSQKDVYNNQVCNFLDYKVAKTQSKFNILRLFKPGELLSSVSSY
jgi:hypothetical protein